MIDNAYVCFFDVLGFTSSFISGKLSKRYDGLIEMTNKLNDQDVTIFLMSDSILCVSSDFQKLLDTSKEFYTWGILKDFWLRGAITRGSVTQYRNGLSQSQTDSLFLFRRWIPESLYT